ncbi:prenyltransferase/squalene oxidase repeat-containing protein [Zavarzinella formosa]|uniref:prenyltransferase/squalene oxidase repeat-containing protein n=1 Tax=Zavarzinella formosa TaxID=360055 RepID=UPI0002EE7378|nr:prenyltransferase/squalene oxidase repeat-containing protein [Zavarzinella formosa]
MQRLTGELVERLEAVPMIVRQRHLSWLLEQQNPDGGFSGREGGSDLYYTGFALRSLAVLQGLTPEIADKAAAFLRSQLAKSTGVVDFFSLLVSIFLVRLGGGPDILTQAPTDWPDRVAETLETYRHADGGYTKVPGGSSGSTYTTFLVALALELLNKTIPQPEKTTAFLHSRYRDGGFVEIPQMKRAGTNPTAAAVGTFQILGTLDDTTKLGVSGYLPALKSDFEGGIRANDRIPTADLLSSFTGAWTLNELGALDRLDLVALREYAESVESPTGGFRGGLWDTQVDVEYTFYGLGVCALTWHA